MSALLENDALLEQRERLAELLGRPEPVSEAVLVAAVHDQTYARNLLTVRGTPELLEHMLANPPHLELAREDAPTNVAGPDPAAGVRSDGAAADRVEHSTVALAARAAQALARWGKTGFALVDDAAYERRMAACASCPHLIEASRHPTLHRLLADGERPKVCGLCGCGLAKKARMVSEQCPADDAARPGFSRWGEPRKGRAQTTHHNHDDAQAR